MWSEVLAGIKYHLPNRKLFSNSTIGRITLNIKMLRNCQSISAYLPTL